MDVREKEVRRRLRGQRGRAVSLVPTPWLFTGDGVRSLEPGENRWRVKPSRGGVRLVRVGSAEEVIAPLEAVCAVRGPRVYVDAQALVVRGQVELMPLPPRYWDGQEMP